MRAERSFRSVLAPMITSYLALKQALGRSYSAERDVIQHLDRYLTRRRADLTPESFVGWCRTQSHRATGVRRKSMQIVRNLCLYHRRRAPSCFVPDPSQFPRPHQHVLPHIFTEDEIGRLLKAADELKATRNSPLRREVFRLAVVLLYTAGLRRRELIRLTVGDYDRQDQVLHVRESKFHKSRLIPLSPDAAREVERYLKTRSARAPSVGRDAPLLCNRWRAVGAEQQHYSGAGMADGIRRLFTSASVRTVFGRLPRVHDLRHAFAVQALVRWYGTGVDVQSRLPFLAAYMGHVSIVSTHYYLAFVPELAKSASDRFAKRCGALVRSPIAQGGGQ